MNSFTVWSVCSIYMISFLLFNYYRTETRAVNSMFLISLQSTNKLWAKISFFVFSRRNCSWIAFLIIIVNLWQNFRWVFLDLQFSVVWNPFKLHSGYSKTAKFSIKHVINHTDYDIYLNTIYTVEIDQNSNLHYIWNWT